MKYVYILQSIPYPDKHYTGIADDVEKRLAKHNAGQVVSSAPYKPWKLETFIGFDSDEKAVAFEQYLKSGSGRAFSKKHL